MTNLEYFNYSHLPERLQRVSKPFAELAAVVLVLCQDNDQRSNALNYLLMAKDAAVRAASVEYCGAV